MISVIIPANNEAGYIGPCLARLLASREPDPPRHAEASGPVQVIVVSNGSTDATVAEARARAAEFDARGWRLDVLDLPGLGKIGALNAGDRAALHGMRVYVDADVEVSPDLLAGIARALDRPEPAFAGGVLTIPPARSALSRLYARFWVRLPFVADQVPGCGVFAVNAAGRARWGDFPDVIADDAFARMNFAPHERHGVPAPYTWPVTEGFANLVRVRRRQDIGLAEIRAGWPELDARAGATRPGPGRTMRLFLADPLGFAVYGAVALAVRTPLFANRGRWDRGR